MMYPVMQKMEESSHGGSTYLNKPEILDFFMLENIQKNELYYRS